MKIYDYLKRYLHYFLNSNIVQYYKQQSEWKTNHFHFQVQYENESGATCLHIPQSHIRTRTVCVCMFIRIYKYIRTHPWSYPYCVCMSLCICKYICTYPRSYLYCADNTSTRQDKATDRTAQFWMHVYSISNPSPRVCFSLGRN